MKKILFTIILLLSLQTFPFSVQADDIREFEIEGISVGDSLLDYFSKNQILKEIKDNKYMYNYLTNEFGQVYKYDGLSKYLMVSFYVKPKDEKFIIHGLTGTMPHVEDITECHNQQKVIANEFSTIFKDSKKLEENYNHGVDKSGKSKVKEIYFLTKSKDEARIICMDFEESLRIKNNWINGLDITLSTKELNDWLSNHIK